MADPLPTCYVYRIAHPGHRLRINVQDFDPAVYALWSETDDPAFCVNSKGSELDHQPVAYTQEMLEAMDWRDLKALMPENFVKSGSWKEAIPQILEYLNGSN